MSPERHAAPSFPAALRQRAAAETISARLPGLLVEAERVAATVTPGVHGRRRTGMGETFWQFRTYQPGDSASVIDWRQSARSRHLFVREQEWEAAESVWLWCDLSPSMSFRSARALPFKWERAMLLVFALAALLVRGGERVALLGSGERPAGGRYGMDKLARSVGQSIDGAAPLPPGSELPRHARLVLVSDFLQPLEVLRARFAQLMGQGARASLLQTLDPAEETLPYEGRVLFEGLEREGSALIDHVGNVRARYAALLQAHREGVAQLSSRQGWRLSSHRTDRSAEVGLMSLAAMLAPRAVS